MSKKHPDNALILALGGPAKVAKKLNLPRLGGVQRVQNWTTRGIPAAVRLEHMSLFAKAERAAEADRQASNSSRPGKREAA